MTRYKLATLGGCTVEGSCVQNGTVRAHLGVFGRIWPKSKVLGNKNSKLEDFLDTLKGGDTRHAVKGSRALGKGTVRLCARRSCVNSIEFGQKVR